MSVEQFETLLKKQKNRCGVCRNEFDETDRGRPHVDHCHTSGHVRGLLCGWCNLAEGYLKTVENARRLLKYMEANELLYGIEAQSIPAAVATLDR